MEKAERCNWELLQKDWLIYLLNDSSDLTKEYLDSIEKKVYTIIDKLWVYWLPKETPSITWEQDCLSPTIWLQYTLYNGEQNKYKAMEINDLLLHIINQL